MNNKTDIFIKIKKLLIKLEKIIAGFSLLLLLIITLSQVVLRNFFEIGFADMDIISRHLVLFITFMGAALAAEGNQHIKMDCINSLLKPSFKEKIKKYLVLIGAIICAIFFWYAVNFWLDEKTYAPSNEQLALYLTLIIPIGFFTLSLHFFLLTLTLKPTEAN